MKLLEAPVLSYPNFEEPFILETDASQFALGAILSQKHGGNDSQLHLAVASSRKRNKTIVQPKKCLAVVWMVRHFRCYLYGRQYKIVTDCQPLKWLMNILDPSSKLARSNLQLQGYDFEIEHRAGKSHANADAFSRVPATEMCRAVELLCVIEHEKLLQGRRDDPKLKYVIRELDRDPGSRNEYSISQTGLLVRLCPHLSNRTGTGSRERIVLPNTMVNDMVRVCRNAPYSGHFRAKK